MARRTSQDQIDPPDDEAERSIPGAAFWALMDRWGVSDSDALVIIGGPPPRKPGTRPRFRLRAEQVDTYEMLRAIDRHLEDLHGAARAWLAQKRKPAPFSGRTPVGTMVAGGAGAVGDVLRALEREAFAASLKQSGAAT